MRLHPSIYVQAETRRNNVKIDTVALQSTTLIVYTFVLLMSTVFPKFFCSYIENSFCVISLWIFTGSFVFFAQDVRVCGIFPCFPHSKTSFLSQLYYFTFPSPLPACSLHCIQQKRPHCFQRERFHLSNLVQRLFFTVPQRPAPQRFQHPVPLRGGSDPP